ncbi:penicillin-binding protein activator [Acinetobacter sp. C_4_1]|uniref:penicillin-binding protein activator n=1 Tax=unclassified Acinetobacter TaxID=196816 RepID=UPI0021B706D5|nr:MULTISPECIES: penicillin-binding protein activator [unclassified Acinetobacter]MCT8088922.1 penicillin-binding protein activator [Acinetobacter sp. F_3_1]MCT8097078.1 penicillin-binding protein activator [Acinetobacter sp. C_3_1]MCT8099929.1 penicillin-binding protein activator [Acinetobacter sp. C_4_1]MCT8134328.1 penicillin-binding protein activator [Acinetobacter sp. T_3_1]
MLNNNKKIIGFILYCIFNHAQAEVLVILPESGPMARAGLSVKQGFMSAYQASELETPIKFVNSDKKPIAQLLKQNVNKKTQMIVGPLPRQDVEALIKIQPKVRVLALNEVSSQSAKVGQFSLSKQDDAVALNQVLQNDQIKELYVLQQKDSETDNELFLISLLTETNYPLNLIEEIPKKLNKHTGLLLLGNNAWLNKLPKLPHKNIYILPNAIEQDQVLPVGVKFCDAPALYESEWPDVIQAAQANAASMAYQRLIAFGGDAWHIASQYLAEPNLKSMQFQGRTGLIQVNNNQIQRIPHCYEHTKKGIKGL